MTSKFGLPLAVAAVAFIAACGDPTGTRAELNVVEDTVELYAINGSHPAAPIGFTIADGALRTLNSAFAFDAAVDLDAQGRVILYPARLVAGNQVPTSLVGLQKVGGTFSSVTRAPSSGYRPDSALTLAVGEVAVIQVSSELCVYALRGVNLYGKFVVDSVRASDRQIWGRLTNNPNCGFRSLVPGIPKD
ncbi:MAG TPA: hypothetical protein VEA99_14935 [Gemmatimonadaceae bacterium]|nr:hypothetical protein [Gemmatimonadaceae bacterium]